MTVLVAWRYRTPVGRRLAIALLTTFRVALVVPVALGKTFFGLAGETFAPGEIVRAPSRCGTVAAVIAARLT